MNIKDLQPNSFTVKRDGKPLNIKDLQPGSFTVKKKTDTPEQRKSFFQKAGDVMNTAKDITEKYSPAGIGADLISKTGKNLFNTYKNVINKLPQDIQAGATDFKKGDIAKGIVKSTLRPAADVAEAIFAPISSAVGAITEKTGVQAGENALANFVVDKTKIADQKWFQDIAVNHPNLEEDFGRVLTLVMANGEKGEINPKAMVDEIKTKVPQATDVVIQKARETYQNYKADQAAKDTAKVDNLAGTITQGKTGDVAAAKRALSDVEVTPKMTYKDLGSSLETKEKNIAQKQDAALATRTEMYKPVDLVKRGHDYVSDGLGQLEDFYRKTNDISNLQRIDQLKTKSAQVGLNLQEMNNLAREHGQKLNAYNANGQLASGLTKQAAENTRSGMKTNLRGLFNDPVLQQTDSVLSDIIRTKELVNTVEEKVNTLKQKIQPRSFGAKVGVLIGKAINLLGLGTPKGVVEALIPRGQGFKVMNALDLEKMLTKNLKALQEATAPNLSEAEITERLQKIIDNPPAKITKSLFASTEEQLNKARRLKETVKIPDSFSEQGTPEEKTKTMQLEKMRRMKNATPGRSLNVNNMVAEDRFNELLKEDDVRNKKDAEKRVNEMFKTNR